MRIQTATSRPESAGPRAPNSLTTNPCSPGGAARGALRWTLGLRPPAPSRTATPREHLTTRGPAEAPAGAPAMNPNPRDPTTRPRIRAQNVVRMIATRLYFMNKLHLRRKLF